MSHYEVYITPSAWKEIQKLPGKIRQRVKKSIDSFVTSPRIARSQELDTDGLDILQDKEIEVRRLRIDNWRIVYAITESEQYIDVLTVRKRPPYDYANLAELLSEIL